MKRNHAVWVARQIFNIKAKLEPSKAKASSADSKTQQAVCKPKGMEQ